MQTPSRAGSGLKCSAVLSVQESADAKERGSTADGVEGRSQKARLKKRLLGRMMAIYSPFCGAASAFDSYATRGRAQGSNDCLHATGMA